MMLRLIGAGMLTLAGLMLGLAKTAEKRTFLRLLAAMDRAMSSMAAEIEFSQRPLPDIFRTLAECGPEETRGFFALLQLERGEDTLERLWTLAAERLISDEEALNILVSLGSVLGRYDGNRQAREIERVRLCLHSRAEDLRQGLESRARNYPALGLCAGAVIAILLI